MPSKSLPNRLIIDVSGKQPYYSPLQKTECNIRMKDKETELFDPLHPDVMSICEVNNFWWESIVIDSSPKESLKDG